MSYYLKCIVVLIWFLIFISTCAIICITNSFFISKYHKSQTAVSDKGYIGVKHYMKSVNTENKDNMIPTTKIQRVLPLPFIVYGTAWKKDRTKDLVELAVKTGFRGIDTACQPKHYYEPGVGEALLSLYSQGVVTRQDLFLQTKFTSLNGQDPNNIPYDKTATLRDQVLQSFQISCNNLHTDYLDSLVLHSPMETYQDTLIVWRAMEEIYNNGGTLHLGISNTYDLRILTKLYNDAMIKPSILQNRFYANSGYDVEIRKFCQLHGIKYQSFWTLSANPHILATSELKSIAMKYNKTAQQIFFKYVQSIGIVPLTGTTSLNHMQEDLETKLFELQLDEIDIIDKLLHI